MFKSRMVVGIGALALLVYSGQAFAGSSDSASAKAKANVKKSIKIVKDLDLDFGNAYTEDPASTLDQSLQQGAKFTVSGNKSTAYTVTLSSSSVTMLTDDGVGADKQIAVSSLGAASASGSYNLGSAGSQEFWVGGTRAALPSTQEAGDYEATFTVTVAY